MEYEILATHNSPTKLEYLTKLMDCVHQAEFILRYPKVKNVILEEQLNVENLSPLEVKQNVRVGYAYAVMHAIRHAVNTWFTEAPQQKDTKTSLKRTIKKAPVKSGKKPIGKKPKAPNGTQSPGKNSHIPKTAKKSANVPPTSVGMKKCNGK